MKIAHLGILSTSIVIILGVFIVLPPYLPPPKPLATLLIFNINDNTNLPQWCYDLSSILEKQKISATFFVTGQIAEKYPACVNELAKENDVGSLTYDYVDIAGQDYSTQLDEVKGGKDAVDAAGNIDSKLFRAPFGTTDGNIYSVLNRSGIVADFSYSTQYNKLHNGIFMRFDALSYNGTQHNPDFFKNLSSDGPIMINFDNSVSIQNIDGFISNLKSRHILLLNASELTELNLTIRHGART